MSDAPTAWAFVPARGGSKSIKNKNMALIAGISMLDWGILAAQESGRLERIICSTDSSSIRRRAVHLGVEVDERPTKLAGDDVAVADVAREFIGRQGVHLPDILVLVQPTSPFLRPDDVINLLEAMANDPQALSGQSVSMPSHNNHAWNQRIVEAGRVRFFYPDERKVAYNKQRKPQLYVFGNLVAIRTRALLRGKDFFAEPSVAVKIDWPYNLDVDGPDDLALANALVASELVDLPYMDVGREQYVRGKY